MALNVFVLFFDYFLFLLSSIQGQFNQFTVGTFKNSCCWDNLYLYSTFAVLWFYLCVSCTYCDYTGSTGHRIITQIKSDYSQDFTPFLTFCGFVQFSDMDQVIANIQPVVDFLEDYLLDNPLSTGVDTLLLVCPCFTDFPPPRCGHCTPASAFPYVMVPRCLNVGEFSWMEMAQPFVDKYFVRLIWRCEDLQCRKECSCGLSSL